MEKELIAIPEFIIRYSISRTALYREVKANRLRLIKRGRRSFIARAAADEWLNNLKASSSSVMGELAHG